MNYFLINPHSKTIAEIALENPTAEDFAIILGESDCDFVYAALPKGDSLATGTGANSRDQNPCFFIEGYPEPFAGKAILFDLGDDDTMKPPVTGIKELEYRIWFPDMRVSEPLEGRIVKLVPADGATLNTVKGDLLDYAEGRVTDVLPDGTVSVFFGEEVTPATGFKNLSSLPARTQIGILYALQAGSFVAGSPAFSD